MHIVKKYSLSNVFWYCGALSGLVFILGTLVLGGLLANYETFAQTVSEIGQVGSVFQFHYGVTLYAVSLLGLIFSYQMLLLAKANKLSVTPVLLIASFALLDAGYAIYPSPEPMHNVVGLLHLFGYFAPLSVALCWKRYFATKDTRHYSGIAFLLILIFLFLNLSPMFMPELYSLQYYGLVQRGLLYVYYLWLVWLSFTLASQVIKKVNR